MWLPATRLVASSHVKLSPARCAAPCCVRDDVTVRPEFGLPSGLRVGTLEPDDLPHCITVLLECFYKDTLTLAESEFSEEEMKKLRPTLEKINGAFTLYNRLALTQTTRLRLGRRLLSGGTTTAVYYGSIHLEATKALVDACRWWRPRDSTRSPPAGSSSRESPINPTSHTSS